MKKVILYGILLLLYRCDLIEYHPYDVRLHGQTGINEKNIARIEESCKGKDTLRFVLMGDSQRWYDETEAFVKALNNRDDVDFVIHGGDISDFGLTKEFPLGAGHHGKTESALRGPAREPRHPRQRDGRVPESLRGRKLLLPGGEHQIHLPEHQCPGIRLLAPRARLHLHVQRTAGHGGAAPARFRSCTCNPSTSNSTTTWPAAFTSCYRNSREWSSACTRTVTRCFMKNYSTTGSRTSVVPP